MRFAENNRISHRQMYRQMILALLAPFMLCVFGKGGMNGISAVAGMIFALILLGFYVIWLIRLTPSFEDPVKSAGAFAGRLIGIFFLDLCVDGGRDICWRLLRRAGSVAKTDHRSIRPDGSHSGRFWYVLSELAKVYREEEEWRKYQVVCFLAGL